ncbi:MAG: tetratricopeptide repeat protein [Variovorax sp.]|nr:MAG: tetratricopeptide repeat protein [Variovorax sp.]
MCARSRRWACRSATVGRRTPPSECGHADPLFAPGSQVMPAATFVEQALAALGAGDLDAAEAACHQALAIDGQRADALHIAGHIAGQRGQREQAIALVEQALARVPNHPQYHYNLAVSLGQAGRENEAALHYQACLRQRPHHGDALWNYGEMLRMAEHFERAAELFLRFEAGGGHYPALHHRLAVCMGALGRDAEAEARFAHELAGKAASTALAPGADRPCSCMANRGWATR